MIVYGPPGTKQLVEGLIAAMEPAARAGYGFKGGAWVVPRKVIFVREVEGGAKLKLPGFSVKAVENSHYSFPEGSAEAKSYKSLSYRFDLPERSIVYTGDTGPSPSLTELAKGADLLVSEMMDLHGTFARIRRLTGKAVDTNTSNAQHLARHHLSPEQVGELAGRAGVKRLVVTHIVPGDFTSAQEEEYRAAIRRHYRGAVSFASDLEKF